MSRKTVIASVVVLAVIIALISLSYPSVVVSNSSTQTWVSIVTYSSQSLVGYPQLTASTALAGNSASTAWYPGNPICDPASNACTPYPTPTATFTYPVSATYTYQFTETSQATLTYTSGYTSFLTQTSFSNVPPYTTVGLTTFQFGIAAIALVAVIALSLLLLTMKREPRPVRKEQASMQDSVGGVKFCSKCSVKNLQTDKFCTNCGTQL